MKILVINNLYREYGGEDANIVDEIKFNKYYDVEYLEYDNSENGFLMFLVLLITPISNLIENYRYFK